MLAMLPETRYARSGDVNVAYQVIGTGPPDIVVVPGWVSNVDFCWEEAAFARFLTRLASFSRVILFDKRGTGLSDRVVDLPSLEVRMDDVWAVMRAVGTSVAALFGYSEGATMCALFAATYPSQTSALVMAGAFPRRRWAPDYPWGQTDEQIQCALDEVEREWGGPVKIDAHAPSMARDEHFRQWWARRLRASASPAAAKALLRMNADIDIRHVLPSIRVPTLILHNSHDRVVSPGATRYMADLIPGAKLVELNGTDHIPWGDNSDAILEEIEEFLTGVRHSSEYDRVLATVLFTDIVGSTDKAVSLGDQRWSDLLECHHNVVRRELERFRGREIATTGDGFLASFDGPARAVRCACAISRDIQSLGIEVRAGLHTGECEVMGNGLGGIAVHIGARIAGLAQTGEVLVSATVKDLVAGSALQFQDRGVYSLKGVPGDWRLFAVDH
ncbi:adenylate/guanylate cyclase domain-containing protein [Paraburkholderia steynii]|uniref:Adenylate/guanylate cyclase domain-containing protein n=1 Tax=Paraburkholderia steynii TaxID=1245441 RepID=A0A4R0X3C1_9BURK|nr:adenylate/guanylate cyclase domain-containing protein [Paraburkholderia steynii]